MGPVAGMVGPRPGAPLVVLVIVAVVALLASACSSGAPDAGDATTDSSAAVPSSTSTTAGAPPTGPTRLSFRPVEEPAVPCPTDPSHRQGVDVLPVVAPQDAGPCVLVGPVGLDGTDIATATATADADAGAGAGGAWDVTVTVADDARAAADTLFDACAAAAPSCPAVGGGGHGRVAVVLDGEVVAAPAVATTGLADDALVVTGGFSQAEAADLAASLGG